jgi:hypothetical protein
VTAFLPPALVFGLGLTATVAPLTATVLASVDEHHVGAASGTNNAVARGAGLLAVALLPAIAHLDTAAPADFSSGFATGMRIAAVVAMGGGVIAWVTIRTAREARAAEPPAVHVCGPVNTVLRPGTPRVEATHP